MRPKWKVAGHPEKTSGMVWPSLDHEKCQDDDKTSAMTFLRGLANANSHFPLDFLFCQRNKLFKSLQLSLLLIAAKSNTIPIYKIFNKQP